jgi:leucyl aminopeptidase
MARLNFTFTYGQEVKTPFQVLCIKQGAAGDVLTGELSDLAKRYEFTGQDGKKFTHQTKDKAQIVLGCGSNYLKVGLNVYQTLKDFPFDSEVSIVCKGFADAEVKDIVTGLKLQAYDFLKYKTVFEEGYKKPHYRLHIISNQDLGSDIEAYDPVIEGVMIAKELGNEPPNILYPESFAKQLQDLFKGTSVKVTVFDHKELEKRGMGGILAVGQGSTKPPCLVTLEYNGGASGEAPLAFVGKAITFDTGGISIKPSAFMEDMRHDMCGGAAVSGLFYALSKRGAKVNAIGVIGMAENMPDGNAYRPADIIKTASGKTIEVLNTDAEGRVVLADALFHAASFKPKLIVDLATLTGAIQVALGKVFAGIFTESDTLSQDLIAAGAVVGEPLWRMPLHKQFTKDIKSKMADVRNTSSGKGAGSSTAAAFLREFVPKEIEWCHMDIAAVAYDIVSEHISREGASGFGVRLLDQSTRGYE